MFEGTGRLRRAADESLERKTEMKRTRIDYGKRYSVKMTIPPEGILDVANNRTEGMVGYFVAAACLGNPVLWQQQLQKLAASCYLQGINDAIEAEMRASRG